MDKPVKLTELERLVAESRRLLPWHVNLRMDVKWWWIGVLHRVPGYRAASFAAMRIKRQGLSGLWEPPFNIYTQDRSVFDKRLRWHGWGVLQEPTGFRGYTPTSRTVETFALPTAWSALETAYRGRGRDAWAWEPLTPAGRAALKETPNG